jgi:hypothetical protein
MYDLIFRSLDVGISRPNSLISNVCLEAFSLSFNHLRKHLLRPRCSVLPSYTLPRSGLPSCLTPISIPCLRRLRLFTGHASAYMRFWHLFILLCLIWIICTYYTGSANGSTIARVLPKRPWQPLPCGLGFPFTRLVVALLCNLLGYPYVFVRTPNPALLRFTGLGGSWSALDCGDHVQFGTGGSRQNACVFRATSKVLPVTDWLFCLQTLQLAAEFTQATASISLANAPASFVDMVQRDSRSHV